MTLPKLGEIVSEKYGVLYWKYYKEGSLFDYSPELSIEQIDATIHLKVEQIDYLIDVLLNFKKLVKNKKVKEDED